MSDGQLAINTAATAPGLFFKNSSGNLVKVGPVHVGTTAPNATPASGGTAGNSVGEQWLDTTGGTYVLKIWDGTDWQSEAGTFVDVNGDTMTGNLVMDNANIVFEGATDDDFETTLTAADPTADRTITLPDQTGNVLVSGNASIVNADVNASAAIAGTKIDPDFGSQTVETTGVFSAAGGGAATPSIAFTGDLNTGIYSPGADQLAISTNGTGRLFISDTKVQVSNPGNTAEFEVGIGATGDNYAVINLIGDTTYPIYGMRMIRSNTGANADSSIFHRGTGSLVLGAVDAGDIRFRTSNTERLRITSDGKVGIGTSSPLTCLHLRSAAGTDQLRWTDDTNSTAFLSTGTASSQIYTNTSLAFGTGSATFSEKARIDSSGRLLVGTSSSVSDVFGASTLQVSGTDGNLVSVGRYSNDQFAPIVYLRKSRGSLGAQGLVSSGDNLGTLVWTGSDGTGFIQGATIKGEVDGTPGTNDMPGRLVFSTTADGASSPTERMRIDSNGSIYGATTASVNGITVTNTNASFVNSTILCGITRAASALYYFFAGTSSYTTSPDNEFLLRGDGQAYADGSWNGGGADYAEYFEWSDGNPDAEDRRGISVVLDGEKIRPAQDGEDPIGVISGNPSVVGDSAWNKWSGKYLRDEFGTYILEDYEVTDDDGNTVTQQRRKLNPAYDPDVEYISREQRPEWDCVGLMGKLRIRKGQPTGSRWIKMRDVSDFVEEWLVR